MRYVNIHLSTLFMTEPYNLILKQMCLPIFLIILNSIPYSAVLFLRRQYLLIISNLNE